MVDPLQQISSSRLARAAALLLSVLLLTACATAPPPPPDLAVEPPPAWTAAPEEAAGTPQAPMEVGGTPVETPAEGWWEGFGDPRLSRLIDEALEHNHELAAAAERIAQAAATARIAGAGRAPQVDAGFNGSRARQNFIGFPILGSEGGVLSTTSTSLGVSVNVSWELDLWGRIGAARRGALAELEAAEADYAAARLSLSGQTAKAWFGLLEAAAQGELARRTVESRRRTAERVQRRYEAGLRGALDLRLALSNLAGAEALAAQREQQLDGSRRQLEVLLGRYPAGEVGEEPAAALELLPSVPGPPPLGLPSELLARRPDLAAAERRLAAAGARVAEARALLYPRIALTGSAGRRSQELEDLLDADFGVWSLAGNLLQPVFAGGRLRAGVDAAGAGFRAAAEGYFQAVLAAFAEVESTLAAEEWIDEQIDALAEADTQARAAQHLAEDRYASGLADYLTVLQSQRDALLAEGQLIDARRRRLEARVDLHLALGGGFAGGTKAGREVPDTDENTDAGTDVLEKTDTP